MMAVLMTARPRQWIKNLLVIAAAGAAGALGQDDVPGRVAFACIAFCLMSAGIYALNDRRDVEEDRQHPHKRLRPVAAGELSLRSALFLGLAWILSGLALCYAIRPLLSLIGLAYVTLTLSYTYCWRQVMVLDIVAVAGGFVLRALAGGVAAPVTLSKWFVLVVSAAAVFLAAAKRNAELSRIERTDEEERSARSSRRVLRGYTTAGLRLVLSGSAACALFAYYVWAFELFDVDGVPWRILTAIPFTACFLRYGSLVASGGGEAPEDVLLSDRPLILSAVAWLLLFALSVHAAA